MQIIVFENDQGLVSILTPADCGLSIEEIAAKDVPPMVVYEEEGSTATSRREYARPYLTIDVSELPDMNSRSQWKIQDGKVVVESPV